MFAFDPRAFCVTGYERFTGYNQPNGAQTLSYSPCEIKGALLLWVGAVGIGWGQLGARVLPTVF